MLNRFRNAFYGSSGSTDDTNVGIDDEELMIDRKGRALTRSSSFREELLNGGTRASRAVPIKVLDGGNDFYDTSQYSQHSLRNKIGNDKSNLNNVKPSKFSYQRPEFLQLRTDDEILVSADHQIRPIILPRDVSRLPWRSGYAECINAGKSIRNEDQATCYQGVAFERNDDNNLENDVPLVPIYESIPWTYFAVFDGHAGPGVAIAAANQLHYILAEKLNSIARILIRSEFEEEDAKIRIEVLERSNQETQDLSNDSEKDVGKEDPNISNQCDSANTNNPRCPVKDITCNTNRTGLSSDDYINGALESSFWEMDASIGRDKREYRMSGGCTAIVGLFILGKLYVCNAGDSRAIVCKNRKVIPMSYDFTPISDQKRIARLALQCPRLLGDTFTQIEYQPRHPCKSHLGTKMFYRDAYMSGFAVKTITPDDLKYPLICGEGKRSRLLATIGVTRGFGDHEMRSQYGSVPIKPFLTPEPEIKKLDIEKDDNIVTNDVLIIGTDGLWDVTSNDKAEEILSSSFNIFPEHEKSRSKYRYMTAAQDLIINSRGLSNGYSVWMNRNDDSYASHDDISAFVIPLKPYKQEYQEWKQTRFEALAKAYELNPNLTLKEGQMN